MGKTERVSKNVVKRTGTLPSGKPYHVEKEDMGSAGVMNRARAGSYLSGKVVHRSGLKKTLLGPKKEREIRAQSVTRVIKSGDGEITSRREKQGSRTLRETHRTSESKGAKHKATARSGKGKPYRKV